MPPREYYLPSRRLVSQEDASIIENANVPRSRFTGSWTRKTTFDAGYLIPFLLDEILPGDHMRYEVTAYVRMSTPLFPLFDNQRIDTFFFFVPNRLLWTNWVRFMGEQDNPADTIAYSVPHMTVTDNGYDVGSIFDHFTLPTAGMVGPGVTIRHSSLPLRAYNLIYNQWFRDENLINSAVINMDDGDDAPADFTLRKRAKSHDYFTSALPWPQKFTAPNIPLGGLAPVLGIGSVLPSANAGPLLGVRESDGTTSTYANYKEMWDSASPDNVLLHWTSDTDGFPAIFADLSLTTGVAINTFRQAFLVNQLLERDARGGTRYVELIRSHFGVTNPDFRLQRPEYIGGGQTPLQITPVAQTAPTDDLPVGALGAAGTAAGTHHASYAATEHGYIIGLINVKSELSYQQGLHKMWSRITRYDFYWPSLAALGEQAISRKELFITGSPANDDAVFGYQERWHELRTRHSEITGLFRSTETGTLDAWHLGQFFTATPSLGQTFIEDTPPMDRVLAAGELAVNQQYLADILIQRNAVRPLPMFGTPATLGRF